MTTLTEEKIAYLGTKYVLHPTNSPRRLTKPVTVEALKDKWSRLCRINPSSLPRAIHYGTSTS